MRTGLAYTEVYDDERSGVWAYYRACGAPSVGYDGPQTLCDYLRTVRKEGAHGEAFAYKTVNSEVMGWVMARATGRSFAQLLHERLWAPLGCEEDGFVSVDSAGMQRAGGGMSATLRDMVRFGELMRREASGMGSSSFRHLWCMACSRLLILRSSPRAFPIGASVGYSRTTSWARSRPLGCTASASILHQRRRWWSPASRHTRWRRVSEAVGAVVNTLDTHDTERITKGLC